jgi:hypothetical protein
MKNSGGRARFVKTLGDGTDQFEPSDLHLGGDFEGRDDTDAAGMKSELSITALAASFTTG